MNAIKKFFAKKGFCADEESASKIILQSMGKKETYKYDEFYKIFCKSIFRISLLDMLNNIEELSKNHTELPLLLKLGAYRRNMLLSSLDRSSQNEEYKDKGRSILGALKLYTEEIDPKAFSDVTFEQFCIDPLGKRKRLDADIIQRMRYNQFEKEVVFSKFKKLGDNLGLDTANMILQMK